MPERSQEIDFPTDCGRGPAFYINKTGRKREAKYDRGRDTSRDHT